ncbi:11496_t:CDS:2 [Scutellospora calospora]|uniref:11496_t:CDS:1 n=1 Tax=Scutellospora calospora TaxID=85575 RepID=A0ACA9KFN4_9GLOM|nr:11496_t:CDS:2 [Scutellospora calospora]
MIVKSFDTKSKNRFLCKYCMYFILEIVLILYNKNIFAEYLKICDQ